MVYCHNVLALTIIALFRFTKEKIIDKKNYFAELDLHQDIGVSSFSTSRAS